MSADVADTYARRGAYAPAGKTSVAPLAIVAGLLLLVPGTLESYVIYDMVSLALGFGVIGAALVLFGIANWVSEALSQKSIVQGNAAFGLGLFLVMHFFALMAFFAGFWMMHLFAVVWPPAGTPEMPYTLSLAMLGIMVASSLILFFGVQKFQRGDLAGYRSAVTLVIVMGLLFLGLRGYEYTHLLSLGFTPESNAYGTCYYAITGFHALSLLVIVGTFVTMLIPALSGRTDKTMVTATSILWYFSTVACIFVVTQVYFWD